MKTTMSVFRKVVFGLSTISALFFISCNKNDDNGTTIDGAGLMALNLVPDATVSFALSGSNITSPLTFNSYTGGYLSIFPGSRTVQAYTFDGLAAQNSINFEPGKYYSLFLIDTGTALKQVIVEDKFDTLASSSQSLVRYVNAIESPTPATITVTANGTNVINEPAIFSTVSGFTPVESGSVTITLNNGSNVNVSRTISLESRKVYTILLSGVPGETGDKAVQIKFIVNGTADATAGRVSGSATTGVN